MERRCCRRISACARGTKVSRLQRFQLPHDIGEGAAGTDGWELARVADEDEPFHVAQRVDEGGELFLGQHGTLVHDDRAIVSATRRLAAGEVGAGITVVAMQANQELRQCLARAAPLGPLLEAYPRLARRGKKQHVLLGEKRAEHLQQSCLSGSCRANQNRQPRTEHLLERGRLLRACALFQLELAFIRILRKRFVQLLVHDTAPIVNGLVRLTSFASEDLLAEDGAALHESIQLIRGLASTSRRTLDCRSEELLRCVEHVLAKRTRRLQGPFPGAGNEPTPRQQGVALPGGLIQKIDGQGPHPTLIGRIVYRADSVCLPDGPRGPPSERRWDRSRAGRLRRAGRGWR